MHYELTEVGPHATRLLLRGRADSDSVGRIEAGVTAQVRGAPGHVVIDMTEVSFMGSLGIRLLIGVGRIVTRRGTQLVLFGVQAPVLQVFETMALGKLLPIVDDETTALGMVGMGS